MVGRGRCVVQADLPFRDRIEDVRKLHVRSRDGKMIPLGTVASVRRIGGPLMVTRYNMYPAAAISANTSPGISSGEGIQAIEVLARRELPATMAYEWTELSYLERTSGSTGLMLFLFSVAFVFLVLAALYESWSLPLAVIMVVPMCVLCSIPGVAVAKLDINIFTQIGFVVLIGLACKNAILIVEFAKLRRDEGEEIHSAILQVCRLRLRPILMTSLAFILGVVPLVLATGAGFEMRRALGTAVFSGMLGVTVFGIFLTPVFCLVVDQVSRSRVEQAVLIAKSLSSLKGAAMKVGQLLSLDLDNYFPPEAIEVLSQLQNAAVAQPFEDIERILALELTSEKRKLIQSVSRQPIGVASIGQVHKARYLDKDIVLKVQYADVANSVESDLKILKTLATSFCQITGRKRNLDPLFHEFRSILEQDLDYEIEAKYHKIFFMKK